ncbi:MAG: DUF1800 family protein, partial [Verrucomicrobiota bacterium]
MVAFNLVRRGSGTRYGYNGIGKNQTDEQNWQVNGWEENANLGLPNSLPTGGNTSTSNWLTLELTMTHVSGNGWETTGRILDDTGTEIFAYTDTSRTTFSWNGTQTLYAGVGVPWVSSNTYQVLSQGGISDVKVDNFIFTTPTASSNQLTANNLNFRSSGLIYPNNGTAGQGGASSGTIVTQPGFNLSSVSLSPTTDFLFRWTDLDLDGTGGNNDYFDFTVRASTGTSDDVTFTSEGIAVSNNGHNGHNGLNPGETLTFEVVDVQLSPNTGGSISFDAFTGGGFFASANASPSNTVAHASGLVNQVSYSVSLNGGADYTSSTTEFTLNQPASTLVFSNVSYLPVGTPNPPITIEPIARARNFDLQFSYTPGPPPPGLPPQALITDPENSDLDNNGLPDFWEALYGAQGLDPNADSDGDGMTNAEEAAFGTDPFDPNSKVDIDITNKDSDEDTVEWTYLTGRPGIIESSTDLGNSVAWAPHGGSPYLNSGMNKLDVSTTSPTTNFFRITASSEDLDVDGVSDWMEPLLGFSTTSNSAYQSQNYDTTGDGSPDTTLSGDLSAFNEVYRVPETGKALSKAQASRLLIQTTFGPSDMSLVDYVASIGAEAWLDEQIAALPSYTQPYIDAIKADMAASPANAWTSSALSGYYINGGGGSDPFIGGINYPTAWLRSTIAGNDQLRQRVAFALSQILVASRTGAGLPNQPRATANYYDLFVQHAFGNYEDLLLDVSLHPYMGNFLSHIGNQKANVAAGIFPDENYAREIMQLFSIGLWELYPDGTRILDGNGEPIETYDTTDITNVAEVFTGTNYNANSFGGGYRDDGDSNSQYMTTPMKVFNSAHDFTTKNIPIGIQMSGGQPVLDQNGKTTRLYHTIPARSQNDANA